MDYREALEIARRNPGASVTRGENGSFVVRRPDGTLLGAPSLQADELTRLKHENERLQRRYDDAFALLDEAKRDHRAELAGLEAKIHELRSALLAIRDEHANATKKVEQLQTKISKVSAEEWERIKITDDKEREELAKATRAARHTQKCACLGEVENCARCDGRGTYITDGYGNIV